MISLEGDMLTIQPNMTGRFRAARMVGRNDVLEAEPLVKLVSVRFEAQVTASGSARWHPFGNDFAPCSLEQPTVSG